MPEFFTDRVVTVHISKHGFEFDEVLGIGLGHLRSGNFFLKVDGFVLLLSLCGLLLEVSCLSVQVLLVVGGDLLHSRFGVGEDLLSCLEVTNSKTHALASIPS